MTYQDTLGLFKDVLELLINYDVSSPNKSDWLFKVAHFENSSQNRLQWSLRGYMNNDTGEIIYQAYTTIRPSAQTLFPWFQDTVTSFIVHPEYMMPVIRLPVRMTMMDMRQGSPCAP